MAESTYTAPATYTITFPSLSQSEVKVSIDGVLQSSGFTISGYSTSGSGTVAFTSAPTAGSTVRIFRDTTILSNQLPAPKSDFQPGASIKAEDLNVNMDQVLYKLAEKIDDGDISNDAVVTQSIRDLNVTTDKIANSNVTTAKIADSNVTTAKINDAAVTTAKLADGAITTAKFSNLSITTALLNDSSVTTAKIADDAVTPAKLANTAVTAGSYTATDITVDAQGRITAASNGAIGTSEITDAAVTTAKIADANVTTAKIADSAVTNAKLADAELVELATMGGNTASALADLTQAEVQILDGATVTTAELNTLDGVTATATEINQLDGNTLKASSTDFTSSIQFPSAAEIDSRITARIDPLGGFEAIADEDNFPATAPPVGTVISIANANSLAVNSSGVGAGTRAGGSDAVVINGFPSGFNSTSLDDGIGLLVIATSTAHTYDFHRVVAKNEDVRQLSSDINDFKARYRIGSSNPTTDNDAGDLFFNTGTSKMLVRNAGNSAWQEVQAVGDFFINTISSSSGTGGGSATFNGSAYRFTLSNAPITAQQLLVSINGVVQKPNSGTSQPSEGFVLNGADIIFSAAPASGAAGFFITIGSSVGIGTPSDNTVSTAKLVNSAVTSAKIADGTIVNADVNASAAIAGTKISPNFGSQNVLTTGNVGIGTTSPADILNVQTASQRQLVVRSGGSPKLYSQNNSGNVEDLTFGGNNLNFFTGTGTDGTQSMRIDSSGRVGIGTTSPGRQLQINGDSDTQIRVVASAGGAAGIQFGDTADTVRGSVNYDVSDNSLQLRGYNNTERLRIDSSGNVGIGTTSPNRPLHISNGGAEGIEFGPGESGNVNLSLHFNRSSNVYVVNETRASYHTFFIGSSEKARIDSSGNVGIGTTNPPSKLVVSDAGSNGIEFVPEVTTDQNLILSYDRSGSARSKLEIDCSELLFTNANTERMRILSSGGLTFNGDTAAANALDDYEEGTWTPTVTNGASGVTVDASNCIYVKVGSLVTCHFEIYDATSPNNNPLDFGGLPYAPDTEGTFPVMSNSVDFPAGRTMLTGYLHPSKWRVYASGNNAGWLALTGNNMSTNGSFIGVISYRST